MKTTRKLLIALASAFAITSMASSANAQVTLYGTPDKSLSSNYAYYSGGASMSGRFSNLGSGYYRNGYFRSNINHPSSSRYSQSGSLSLEFWGNLYYGGSSGYVLRTKGFGQLTRGWYISPASSSGGVRFINRWLWPSIKLQMYNGAWYFQSQQNFSRTEVL